MTGRHKLTMELPDFGEQQACLTLDPELFFPDPTDEEQRAHELTSLCGTCPVRVQCLEWALAHREAGIWAGTTSAERHRARRRATKGRTEQQQRTLATRATVHALAAKGLTSRQIIDQTGLHERTVYRAMRSFRGQPERSAA